MSGSAGVLGTLTTDILFILLQILFFLPVLYDDTGVLMTTFACTTDNKTMTSRRINNDTPQNDA